MRRIAWLDTLRVLASLLVVFSHYVYTVLNTPISTFARTYLLAIGNVGVVLFFAISGYLAANSLKRSAGVLEFYRRKFIRITVPYATAYIICFAGYMALAALFPSLTNSKLASNISENPQALGFVLGMLPIDINLMKFFNLEYYNIVGEWFIGTVVLLYIIAPLLYKCAEINLPATAAASIAIALLTFDLAAPLVEEKRIATNLWLFTARAPEFLAGMVIFKYRDSFLKYRGTAAKILSAAAVLFAFQYVQIDAARGSIWQQLFFPYSMKFIIAAFLTICLAYILASLLNEIFPAALNRFNGFSRISYMAMLIHHLIVYQFVHFFDYQSLDILKFVLIFPLILGCTVVVSEIFCRIYKPIENKLIKG